MKFYKIKNLPGLPFYYFFNIKLFITITIFYFRSFINHTVYSKPIHHFSNIDLLEKNTVGLIGMFIEFYNSFRKFFNLLSILWETAFSKIMKKED